MGLLHERGTTALTLASMQAADAMVDTATVDWLCAAQRGRIAAAAAEGRLQRSPILRSTSSVGSRRFIPTRTAVDSPASSRTDITGRGAALAALQPVQCRNVPGILRSLLPRGRLGAPASCRFCSGLSRTGCLPWLAGASPSLRRHHSVAITPRLLHMLPCMRACLYVLHMESHRGLAAPRNADDVVSSQQQFEFKRALTKW